MVREWIFACFEGLGFGPHTMRWLRLLLQGTKAVVSFGGCFSRVFAVLSGAAQGSPLSPLLYVAAAQPLAAALRHLQEEGSMDAVRLPGGVTAPASYQHADDTTIHTATVEGAQTALDRAVQPFCRASGSQLNISKSEGLTLGTHPPLEGVHAATGVKFVGPGGFVQHLGVLLTKGSRDAAAAKLWQKRVGCVAAHVRHWSTVDLTLLGRVYVARQVMANTITYHAQFVPPPPRQMRALQRLIDGFVLGRPVDPATDDRPLRGRPSAAEVSLPFPEGGLGAGDVELQATAMHAKVAARLLHPQRQPWKTLAHAEFARALPGVGVAAMVTTLPSSPAAGRHLTPRLASSWAALRRTHLLRLVPPDDMLAQQVGGEPLAGNLRVAARPGARPALSWGAALRQWGAARRLRDLAVDSSGQLPASVPQPWAAKLSQPAPATDWTVSPDGAWVRHAPGGVERWFRVAPDGRLLDPAASEQPPSATTAWEDVCVVACPLLKGRPPGVAAPLPPLRPWHPAPAAGGQADQPQRQPTEDLYLVGAWAAVPVDPSLWGHDDAPLTHYSVKAATLRMKRLRAVGQLASRYSPGEAVAPALWGPGAAQQPAPGALQAREAQQAAAFRAKCRLPAAARAAAASDDQLAAIYRQSWMEPSPARPAPDQRAQQRRAQPGPAPHALGDDCADILRPWDPGRPAWREAWTQAHKRSRPRHHRVFMWQLLHAALPVGAAKVAFVPPGAEHMPDVACCANLACRPTVPPGSTPAGVWRLETLSHALLDCPAVAPALQWLAQLWVRIDGAPQPPMSPDVWLQADPAAWQPQRTSHADLWCALRVAMLAAAWSWRLRRAASGEQFGPRHIVFSWVADVRRLVMADWQVATSSCTEMAGAHRSWFPGREPHLDLADFELRWCGGGVVAHVAQGAAGQPPRLEFRLGDAAEAAWPCTDAAGGGASAP